MAKEKKTRKRTNQPVPPEITEARERRAYHLKIIEGRKLHEITGILNNEFPSHPLKSDHQAVAKMIERVQFQYAKRDKEKVDEILAEASANLDFARLEAIKAWGESKGISKIIEKLIEKPVKQVLKESVGDPQFLKIIESTSIEKAKLFGAVAPKKHEITGKGGVPFGSPSYNLNALSKFLTDEQLETIQEAAEILERAQFDLEASVKDGGSS